MTAKQLTLPAHRAFNSDGAPESGAMAILYLSGTTTPTNFYADAALTVSLGHIITANAAGRFAPMPYQDSTTAFRLVIEDAEGTVLDDIDPFFFGLTTGVDGVNASIAVGTTTTGVAGSAASVTNSGTGTNAVLNFSVPAGIQGPAGDVAKVLTRTELAAVSLPVAGMVRYLAEGGREGLFVWSSADNSTSVTNDSLQGVYVAPATAPTGTSGAWVRKFSGATSVKWFGATGNGVTDDSTAITGAIAFLKSIAGNPVNTYYKASGKLAIPAGKYNCASTTIEITHTLIIEGEGGGGFGAGGGAATMLTWADGVTGIRVQEYNTSGVSTVDASPYHFTAAYTTLKGLYLYGGFSNTESESHGIHTKTKIILDDVVVDNFSGDALYAHTTNGGGSPIEGNSNCSRAYNCHFRNSRNGLSITGGDANAWLFTACFFDYNRSWGVNDTAFLGNTYIGCHEDSNGITGNSTNFGASVVTYNGNRYACIYGQEATASVTAPSGDTTDTVNWYYIAAGGVGAGGLFIPVWVSGMTLRAGGPMLLHNNNQNSVVSGNYVEGGQGPIQQTQLGLVIGGSNNTGVKGGSWLRGWTSGYFRTTPQITVGNLQQWQRNGESLLIDGSQDATSLVSPQIIMKTGIVSTGSSTLNFLKSDGTNMGKVSCVANFGLIADGALGTYLRTNAVDIANTNTTGFNIASGKNLQYAGTPVLTTGVLTSAAFPTLTGDVSNTGLAVTIPANTITYSKFQQVAASSLVGNATGVLANATGITLAGGLTFSGSTLTVGALTPTSVNASGTVLGSNLSGTNTGDQTITLTGPVTGTGTGSFATTITAGAVTRAMMANTAAATVLGSTAAGAVAELTAAQGRTVLGLATVASSGLASDLSGTLAAAQLPALTGDTTSSAGSAATSVVSATGNGTDFVVASGNRVKVAGNPSVPTPASTDGYVFHTTANGVGLVGNGSSFDFTLYNSGGSAVMTVPHSGTTITCNNALTAGGSILSSNATAGVGYKTGAGGAVTQLTSRTTGVTLNTICGAITLFSAAGSATYNTFTVTNSAVAATDVIEVSQKSGANLYNILVTAVAAGSFNLSVSAVSGTATEAPVINFTVLKAVTA